MIAKNGLIGEKKPFLSTAFPHLWTKQQNISIGTLTDAATIAWDLEVAQVATITLGGNRILGNPTNIVDGATYVLRIQSAGYVLTYESYYDFGTTGTPTLSAAGKWDYLCFVGRSNNKMDFQAINTGFTV